MGECPILSLADFGADSFILSLPGRIIAGLSRLGIRAPKAQILTQTLQGNCEIPLAGSPWAERNLLVPMKTLAIALLALVALLTGGCSGFFLIASLLDSNPGDTLQYVGVPALIGLAVCAACVLIIRALSNPAQAPAAPPQDPSHKDRW